MGPPSRQRSGNLTPLVGLDTIRLALVQVATKSTAQGIEHKKVSAKHPF